MLLTCHVFSKISLKNAFSRLDCPSFLFFKKNLEPTYTLGGNTVQIFANHYMIDIMMLLHLTQQKNKIKRSIWT